MSRPGYPFPPFLRPAALLPPTSMHLQLHRLHVYLCTLTARRRQTNTSPCYLSESLKDKWPWVLTMAVILWRGREAVCLYPANLITGLLSAFVSTQCNLKATPGPLGDAKQTTCQSTGTPPKWIKVGYSGPSWPWGDVHTGFCSWRNTLNTIFYYRATVKCVMYVNPSETGRRDGFCRDKIMASREERREAETAAETVRELVQTGRRRRPVEGERDIEKMIERWQNQADAHIQLGTDRESQDRQMEGQGHTHIEAEKPSILIFVTHHVWHRSDIFLSMWRKAQHDFFFFYLNPRTTGNTRRENQVLIQLDSARMTIREDCGSPETADIMFCLCLRRPC